MVAGLLGPSHLEEASVAVYGRGSAECFHCARNQNILKCVQATAALDHKSEARFQRVLETQFESSTIICVAHRLENLQWCNTRVVMAQGNVVAITSLRK